MKKVVFSFFIFFVAFLFFTRDTYAALVVVDSKGEIVWQVLGDETSVSFSKPTEIRIKSVAQGIGTSNSQIALNNENGRIVLNGVDVTSLKDNLVEIQARGSVNEIKIGQVDGQFNIEENGITAKTNFPITIDATRNELSIKTETGMRLISVLPYEAVLSLIRAKLIDKVNDNSVNLTESLDGQLQYQVDGIKNINLFNVAKVDAKVISTVSATTGEILKMEEPQWLKLFGFLFKV